MNRLPESPQKDGGRIEVEAQESENRARQGDGHHGDQRRSARESATTNATRVENRADPAASPSRPSIRLNALVMASTHRTVKAQSDKPGQAAITEQDRDVDDAQTAHEQHGRGDALHGKLEVRADAAEVVVDAQQEDERGRARGWSTSVFKEKARCIRGLCSGPERGQAHAAGEGKKNGDAAQPRQRSWNADDVPAWELRPSRGRSRNRERTGSARRPTAALQQMSRGKCQSTTPPSASKHADHGMRARPFILQSIAAMPCG